MKFKVERSESFTNKYDLVLNEEQVLKEKDLETITNAIKDYLQIFARN